MNKAQKTITWFFTIAIVIIASLYFVYIASQNNEVIIPGLNETVLYYGEDCPHCKIVDEFILNNSIESRITITHKEIWYNKTNAKESLSVLKFCKIDPNTAGVPLMFADGECYLGDVDVINYFKSKLNITSD